MQLMMYIGNDLIEAVPLHLGQLSQPGYLGKFKRILKQKHSELIQESAVEPEFLVANLSPTPQPYHTCPACATVAAKEVMNAARCS